MSTSAEPRLLSVEQILACNDIEERTVEVPQWRFEDGSVGSVRIRSFTKVEQQRLRKEAVGRDGEIDNDKLELLVFIAGVVAPKFEAVQFLDLRKKSAAAIDGVIREIFKLSGMGPEAAKSGGAGLPD